MNARRYRNQHQPDADGYRLAHCAPAAHVCEIRFTDLPARVTICCVAAARTGRRSQGLIPSSSRAATRRLGVRARRAAALRYEKNQRNVHPLKRDSLPAERNRPVGLSVGETAAVRGSVRLCLQRWAFLQATIFVRGIGPIRQACPGIGETTTRSTFACAVSAQKSTTGTRLALPHGDGIFMVSSSTP